MAGTGYLFGAYFACAWPAASAKVGDPSGRSFLFSLVNKQKKAVQYTLHDKRNALQVATDGICFGATNSEDKRSPNVLLMFMQYGATDLIGNCTNYTANCAFQPKGTMALQMAASEGTFLAGSQYFAAEEIEVYQLAPAPAVAAGAAAAAAAN